MREALSFLILLFLLLLFHSASPFFTLYIRVLAAHIDVQFYIIQTTNVFFVVVVALLHWPSWKNLGQALRCCIL